MIILFHVNITIPDFGGIRLPRYLVIYDITHYRPTSLHLHLELLISCVMNTTKFEFHKSFGFTVILRSPQFSYFFSQVDEPY